MMVAVLAAIAISTNSISFTATATGVGMGSPLEFMFVGSGSDHDYEAAFLIEDSLVDFAAAFDRAGIAPGTGYDPAKFNFWPTGKLLTMKPALSEFITCDGQPATGKVVYAGAKIPADDATMSLFAFYNCRYSLMFFNDSQPQGEAYGRYHPARTLKAGEKVEFTLSWNGKDETYSHTPDFSPEMTVAMARQFARNLETIELVPNRHINGAKEGQFYFRAFLPQEKWRDRHERLQQPLEIHLKGTNLTYTVIDEDWSGEGEKPKLTVKNISEHEAKQQKTDTGFIYASADEKLARLFAIKSAMPKTIINWYVYID